MEKINYESIKKYIKDNQDKFILINKQISDIDIQKEILKNYLSDKKITDTYIEGPLSILEINDLIILDYKTLTNNSQVNHLIIVNNDKDNPLFEVSYESNLNNGNGIIIEENKIYDQNKKIVFAIKKMNKVANNSVINSQVVLTEKINYSHEYVIKHYDFTYNQKECIIFSTDNNYQILGNESFINRLELANSHIQKLETIFESYLKSNFGIEETKTYQIKRKIKKN